MKDCFIIMPITTPDFALNRYNGDKFHFGHVLDHLFIPAIEKAKLNPIPPITKGAELIQGDIIKNLEKTDLVMCDISCLNPNVFFELGIRTALNKPTCLVRDDTTDNIPFDTTIINHYDYKSSLHAWELEGQVESLTNHIKDTMKNTDGQNALWKYFGITMTAEPSKEKGNIEAKLDILSKKLESIGESTTKRSILRIDREFLLLKQSLLKSYPNVITSVLYVDGVVYVGVLFSEISNEIEQDMIRISASFGLKAIVRVEG